MWRQVSTYASVHSSCLHLCLPGVNTQDKLGDSEDEMECSFDGFGAFCHGWNYFKYDKFPENDPEFSKDIVKILDHILILSK